MKSIFSLKSIMRKISLCFVKPKTKTEIKKNLKNCGFRDKK